MNWNGKNVLVCGGAGLIGSYLARELLKRGAEVTIADNFSSGIQKNIDDIRGEARVLDIDLRNNAKTYIANGMDVIFQLAANMGGIGYITSIGADIMKDSAQVNINMLEAAVKYEVPNYFYSSSACIYPEYLQKNAEVTALKESDAYPAEPDQFYGWEKLFTEKMCEAYHRDYGLNVKVARFHNVFGGIHTGYDKQKAKAPCHLIIKTLRHPNPPFIIWGDGEQTRSFLYIDDCVEGVLRLIDSDWHEPINIGSDHLVTINELADIIIGFSGKEIVPEHDLSKPQGVRGRNADLTLVEKVLNWRPEVSLEDGLLRTFDFAIEYYDELKNI